MNILIAADSFKDALGAAAVCAAMEKGVRMALPDATILTCPLADGGEGTGEVLATALRLNPVDASATDPIGRPITARFGYNPDNRTAFVEMARTAGLQLLAVTERNPLHTTTYGVGQQLAAALEQGVAHVILAIGGSATNDAGTGMAAALGWRFLDKNDRPVRPAGENLIHITQIIPPDRVFPASVEVICDVTNPLFGPHGAARVYARQKGADDAAIEILDEGLAHFAQIAARAGYTLDPNAPGSGAAGGMGYGARLFLNARLRSGIDVVLDMLDFEHLLAETDLLITGEGKIDHQTGHGKLIQGLCRRAARHGVPVVAFCGVLEASTSQISDIGLHAAFSINDHAAPGTPIQQLIAQTASHLETTAHRVFADISWLYPGK